MSKFYKPEKVINYLVQNSWIKIEEVENKYSVWYKEKGTREFEIWVPLGTNFKDFQIRLNQLLNELSKEQGKDIQDIEAHCFSVIA